LVSSCGHFVIILPARLVTGDARLADRPASTRLSARHPPGILS